MVLAWLTMLGLVVQGLPVLVLVLVLGWLASVLGMRVQVLQVQGLVRGLQVQALQEWMHRLQVVLVELVCLCLGARQARTWWNG